jgi:DNA-binding IclR family transcriptional regulator
VSVQVETTGTVARVVRLLQYLAEVDDDISIKDMAAHLHLPPSTVHRLLNLLVDDGIVERSRARHVYRPGLELIRIASLIASKTRVADLALPVMRAVVAACNEVCMLVLYLPAARRVMIATSVDSSHPLRYQVERFVPHSLLWGATGRSTLAFLPPDVIDAAIAENESSPGSGASLPPRAEFLAELAAIRERGYVLTVGQKIADAVGIGAPIFNADGSVLGSLCITIPVVRFDPQSEGTLAKLLLEQVAALNTTLGHVAPLRAVRA